MTVSASAKKRCPQCRCFRRHGKVLVRCKIKRHNQRQG